MFIDALTVVACFGVVMMHANYAVFRYRDSRAWYGVNVPIEFMFLWAVPVFLMISGATIIGFDKRYDLKAYAGHRFRRAVVPFLFWSIAGVLFDVFLAHSLSRNLGFRQYVQIIISTASPTMNVLWFFIPLFAFYLCAPALTAIPEDRRIGVFRYLIAVSFLTVVLIPDVLPVLGLQPNAGLINPMAAGYLIYPLLGYVLSRIDLDRKWRLVVFPMAVIGLLVMIVGTCVASRSEGRTVLFHGSTLGVAVLLLSVAVFLLIRKAFDSKRVVDALAGPLRRMAPLCLGIYMTHRFLLAVVVHFLPSMGLRWWWPIVAGPMLFLASAGVAFLLRHAPLLRATV